MSSLVRIDGPVKIGPNQAVDLSPYLEEVKLGIPGYEAAFRVASIVLADDRYDFDQIKPHSVDTVGRSSDSLTFAIDDPSCIRSVDFGLTEDNTLIILAHDPAVKEVLFDYIDINPL